MNGSIGTVRGDALWALRRCAERAVPRVRDPLVHVSSQKCEGIGQGHRLRNAGEGRPSLSFEDTKCQGGNPMASLMLGWPHESNSRRAGSESHNSDVVIATPFHRLVPDTSLGPQRQRTLADIENAFFGIFDNFPIAILSLAMRGVAFPTGRCYKPPSDSLAQEVAQLVSTDTAVRRHSFFCLFVCVCVSVSRVSSRRHSRTFLTEEIVFFCPLHDPPDLTG